MASETVKRFCYAFFVFRGAVWAETAWRSDVTKHLTLPDTAKNSVLESFLFVQRHCKEMRSFN